MITVDRQALIRALKTVTPAVSRGGNVPALLGVRLLTTTEGLTATASNLDLTIGTVTDCDGEDLDVIVSAATLSRFAAASRGQRLTLTAEDGTLHLDGGTKSTIRTIDATWPNVDTLQGSPEWVDLSAEDVDAIGRVIHAASADTTRGTLCGVHFNGSTVEATDSHRAARVQIDAELPEMLIEATALKSTLAECTSPFRVRSDGKRVEFSSGPTTVIIAMIPATSPYPDISQLVARMEPKIVSRCTVDALDMLDLIERLRSVSVDSAESPLHVSMDDGQINVRRAVQGSGDIADDITPHDGDICTGDRSAIGIRATFLADAIENARVDQVVMESGGWAPPIFIRSERYTALVMPVRIS